MGNKAPDGAAEPLPLACFCAVIPQRPNKHNQGLHCLEQPIHWSPFLPLTRQVEALVHFSNSIKATMDLGEGQGAAEAQAARRRAVRAAFEAATAAMQERLSKVCAGCKQLQRGAAFVMGAAPGGFLCGGGMS